jgi:hypothetical protein
MRLPGGKKYFVSKEARFKGGPLRIGDLYGEKGYPESRKPSLEALFRQIEREIKASSLYVGNGADLKSK